MITELTKEQEALLPVWRDKWLKIGFATGEVELEPAKDAVRKAYQAAKLTPPETFYVCDSPVSAAKLAARLKFEEKGKTLDESTKEFKEVVWQSLNEQIYGFHDAGWLSFHDYFLEVVGLECVEPLRGLIDLAKVCGWWAPYEKVAILQHRPMELHQDEEGRLHNLEGPAVLYKDGFAIFAVHGVRLPRWIIEEPYNITPEKITEQENAEIRRVMLDIFGWERYLKESDTALIASDSFGTLYQKELADDEPLLMVKVVDSTPEPDGSFKEYYLRIDPNAYKGSARTIPQAAVASTWRTKSGDLLFPDYRDYVPAIET